MANEKICVLYDRVCVDCGECDMCDLDPTKVCDNCGKCIHTDADYKVVMIDKVVKPEDEEFIDGEI